MRVVEPLSLNRVFPRYTKLAMLSFLYCLRGEEEKNNFSKKILPVGIEPGTSYDPSGYLPD